MGTILDFRVAVRTLARRPGVPAILAALFALSVGLASGMWAVVDAVALRPLPYRNAERLVVVMERHPERGLMAVPPANFLDWKDRATTLENVTGFGSLEANLEAQGAAVRVIGTRVTERFFDLLGVAPAIGRGFTPADFASGGRVAVIGHALWSRQFQSSPGIIGTAISIDGDPHTVVGVMPRDFKTIGHSEIWVPWLMSPAEQAERRFHLVSVIARLRPQRSVTDAQQELRNLYRQIETNHPDTTTNWTANALPLRDLIVGDSRRSLLILGAAVLVLIVVASINITGLLFAWLPARRQEFVVRMALGASASRVVGQLLAETLIWAVAGMLGGVALALAFVELFGTVGISTVLEYDFAPRIDARALLVMTTLLVVNIGITALVPAITASGAREIWSRAGRGPRAASATAPPSSSRWRCRSCCSARWRRF